MAKINPETSMMLAGASLPFVGNMIERLSVATRHERFNFAGTQQDALQFLSVPPNRQQMLHQYVSDILAFSTAYETLDLIDSHPEIKADLALITSKSQRGRRLIGPSGEKKDQTVSYWMDFLHLTDRENLNTDELRGILNAQWEKYFGKDQTTQEAVLRDIGRNLEGSALGLLMPEEESRKTINIATEELADKGYWPLLAVMLSTFKKHPKNHNLGAIDNYMTQVDEALFDAERKLTRVEQFVECFDFLLAAQWQDKLLITSQEVIDHFDVTFSTVDPVIVALAKETFTELLREAEKITETMLAKAGLSEYPQGDWHAFALQLPEGIDYFQTINVPGTNQEVRQNAFLYDWEDVNLPKLQRTIKDITKFAMPSETGMQDVYVYPVGRNNFGVFILTSNNNILSFNISEVGSVNNIPFTLDSLTYGEIDYEEIAGYILHTAIEQGEKAKAADREQAQRAKLERRSQQSIASAPGSFVIQDERRHPGPITRKDTKRKKEPAWQRAANRTGRRELSGESAGSSVPPKILDTFSETLTQDIVNAGFNIDVLKREIASINDLLVTPGSDYRNQLNKTPIQPSDTTIELYRFQWTMNDFRIMLAKVSVIENGKARTLYIPLELINHKILDTPARFNSKIPSWTAQAQKMRDEIQQHINNLEEQ